MTFDYSPYRENSATKGVQDMQLLRSMFARRRAGQKMATGDAEGAAKEFYNAGDITSGQNIEKNFEEQRKQRAADLANFTDKVSTGLLEVWNGHSGDPDGGLGEVQKTFEQIAPMFKQRGVSDDAIERFRQGIASRGQDYLTVLGAKAKGQMRRFSTNVIGQDLWVTDLEQGTSEKAGSSPKTIVAPKGGKVVEVPATMGGPQPAAPVPDDMETMELYPGSSGKTLDEAVEIAKKQFPGAEVSVDGDHVRIVRPKAGAVASTAAPAAPRRAQVIAEGNQDKWRAATPAEAHARGAEAGQINGLTGEFKPARAPAASAAAGGAAKPARLSQSEESELKADRAAWQKMQAVMPDLEEFMDLNSRHPTGAGMAMPGAGAVIGAFNKDIARMNAISSAMVPLMRNGLPGAASNLDVRMFREAGLSVAKPYGANLATANAMKAWNSRLGDYIAFREAYALQHGTLKGSTELWKKYVDANPLFRRQGPGNIVPNKVKPWREAIPMGTAGPGVNAAGPRVRVFNRATGKFD